MRASIHFLQRLFVAIPIAVAIAQPAPAVAQPFPSRPVRLLVAEAAGGIGDISARVIGAKLTEGLRQQVVIENQPGPGAMKALRDARPDGYTLLMTSDANLAQLLISEGLEPAKTLTPIAYVGALHYALAVPPSAPYKSLQELLAGVKQKPLNLGFGESLISRSLIPHLFGTNSNVVPIPFKGPAPAVTEAISGRLDSVIATVRALAPQQDRLRVLAVFSATRHPQLPNIPTAREQGVNLVVFSAYGILGPAGLPQAERDRIEQEVRRATSMPEVIEQLRGTGLSPSFGSSEDYRTYLANWSIDRAFGGGGLFRGSCTNCNKDKCETGCAKLCCSPS